MVYSTRFSSSIQLYLCVVFVCSSLSFAANVTFAFEDEYVTSDHSDPIQTIKISKAIFGAIRWKFGKNSFMAPCTREEDCDAGIRLICQTGRCVCKQGDLFIEWPKYGCFSKVHMFGQCEVSGQCVAMNSNTYCNPDNGRCTCSPNYFYNGRECTLRYDGSNLKAQEVYKAAVVAAACFIVAIVGIFVACIVRRSFCRRDQHLQQNGPNRDGDIFSISDEIAALRAVDKPPSYEEVLQIERTFYGIPPPEYAPTPRIISSLSAFEPNTNRPPPLPLPYNPNYVPPSACQAVINLTDANHLKDNNPVDEGAVGGLSERSHVAEAAVASSNFLAAADVLYAPSKTRVGVQAVTNLTDSNHLNDNNPVDEGAVGGSSELSHVDAPAVASSDFLAAAEVLTAPSETREDVQASTLGSLLTSENPNNYVQSCYISSTPPPRRLNHCLTPSCSSSSLPGSPNLSSFRVLNLPKPVGTELKQNFSPSEPNLDSHASTEAFETFSRNSPPSTSGSQEQFVSAVHNNSKSNNSELAYDNPGFVSDLQA